MLNRPVTMLPVRQCLKCGRTGDKGKTLWILMTAQICVLAYFHRWLLDIFSTSLLVPVKIDRCLFLWLILELFVLIVCHFTETMSLDQHVLMNVQKVQWTGDKVDWTGNIVAGSVDFVAGSFQPWQKLIFVDSCFDIRLCRQCVPGLIVTVSVMLNFS